VRVLINDVERTSAGAGFGIDPYEVLVPTNRLVATTQPRTVPIARCGACGVSDCVGTDVTIVRDDDLVHWDDYQILVTTPWRGRRPEEVADTPASRTGFRSSGLP
jgi:hypothetical protein